MIDLRRPLGFHTDIELDDSEYQRPPRIRKQAGELDMEAESTLVDVRPRQRWTTDKPRTGGYFWVRVPGHDAKVVEVFADHMGRLLMQGNDWRGAVSLPDGLVWGTCEIPAPMEER